MWCNGFLQTLELRPRSWFPVPSGPLASGFGSLFSRSCVDRLILNPSGGWNIATDEGEYHEAVWIGGWVSAGGAVMALAWSVPYGRRRGHGTFRAWLLARDHDTQTWRRLLTRLRMQI
jgi:hypothetical protein